jgi:hypothetical protein
MADDSLVFESIQSSNMPTTAKKSAIRKWAEGMLGNPMSNARGHVVEGAHAFRQTTETLMTAGIMGYIHAESDTGLDMPFHDKHIPLDIGGGALAIAASVVFANDGISSDLRNVGSTMLGIGMFRKSHDFFAEKKMQRLGHGPMAGEGDDDILKRAAGIKT